MSEATTTANTLARPCTLTVFVATATLTLPAAAATLHTLRTHSRPAARGPPKKQHVWRVGPARGPPK